MKLRVKNCRTKHVKMNFTFKLQNIFYFLCTYCAGQRLIMNNSFQIIIFEFLLGLARVILILGYMYITSFSQDLFLYKTVELGYLVIHDYFNLKWEWLHNIWYLWWFPGTTFKDDLLLCMKGMSTHCICLFWILNWLLRKCLTAAKKYHFL